METFNNVTISTYCRYWILSFILCPPARLKLSACFQLGGSQPPCPCLFYFGRSMAPSSSLPQFRNFARQTVDNRPTTGTRMNAERQNLLEAMFRVVVNAVSHLISIFVVFQIVIRNQNWKIANVPTVNWKLGRLCNGIKWPLPASEQITAGVWRDSGKEV